MLPVYRNQEANRPNIFVSIAQDFRNSLEHFLNEFPRSSARKKKIDVLFYIAQDVPLIYLKNNQLQKLVH